MMPKGAKRFSKKIMLQALRIDHVYDLGSIRPEMIVIADESNTHGATPHNPLPVCIATAPHAIGVFPGPAGTGAVQWPEIGPGQENRQMADARDAGDAPAP